MGVKGLLPQLKEIQVCRSLERFRGKTLAIDSYAWLHKSIISCAWELAQDLETTKYVSFFRKRVLMLKHFGIEPYFVFDGDNFASKVDTELEREVSRQKNKEKGLEMLKIGDKKLAGECFMKSIDVTPSMARSVINYLKSENIKYIVAPYEADPQMIYLEKLGLVQGILSEDSDLLIFGAQCLLTKLNDFGECIEINRDNFKKCKAVPIGLMNDSQLRMVACLSGCDYTNGIPNVGIVTAFKLVKRYSNMHKCLMSLKLEGKTSVPNGFEMEYKKADISFQYQRVFNPITNQISTLNEIPPNLPVDDSMLIECIGKLHDNSIHQKIAYGELDPITKGPLRPREEIIKSKSFNIISKPLSKESTDGRTAKRSHSTPVGLGMKTIDSFFKSQVKTSVGRSSTIPSKAQLSSQPQISEVLLPDIPLDEIKSSDVVNVRTPTFNRMLTPKTLSPTSKRRKMFNQPISSSIQTPASSKFFSSKRSPPIEQPQIHLIANVSNSSRTSPHIDHRDGMVGPPPLDTPISKLSENPHEEEQHNEELGKSVSKCTSLSTPKSVLNDMNSSDFDLTDPDDDEVETPNKFIHSDDHGRMGDTPVKNTKNKSQSKEKSHEEIAKSLYQKFGFSRDGFDKINDTSLIPTTTDFTRSTVEPLKPIQQNIKPGTTTIKTKRSITKNLTLDSFIYRGA